MKIIICCFLFVFETINCGLIPHESLTDSTIHHHEHATSYQNIHIEHFHPVPTFIKKEYKELLEHPVPIGETSSKIEVHHGDKHDHGYAIANYNTNKLHQDYQNHQFLDGHGFDGHASQLAAAGHEDAALASNVGDYQVDGHEHTQFVPSYGGDTAHTTEALQQQYYAGDEQLTDNYNYQ